MKKGWHDKAIHQETFDLPHPWCWSCSAKLAKDTLKRTRGMRFLRLRPQKREGMKSITSADCTPRCINYFDKFTPTRINYFGQQNLIAGAYVRPCMWVCVCVCEWLSHFSRVQLFTNLWTVGLETVGLLFPLDSPGKNPEVGCHALLQGIFPTQGSNHRLLCLPHCRQVLDCWATGEVLPGHHWPKYNSAKW